MPTSNSITTQATVAATKSAKWFRLVPTGDSPIQSAMVEAKTWMKVGETVIITITPND